MTIAFPASKLKKTLAKIPSSCAFFIVAALLGGVFFAVKTPVGFTADESVHAYRTYQVSRGQLTTYPVGTEKVNGANLTLYGGSVPTSLIELEQYTSAGIRHTALCSGAYCKEPSEAQKRQAHELANEPIRSPRQDIYFWGANAYSSLPYVPSALGMGIAQIFSSSVGTAVLLSRITSVIFYVAIVACAIFLLRHSCSKWVVISLAMLPVSLSQAASNGTDMFLNAMALLLFAVILRSFLDGGLSRHLWLVAIVSAIALPLCKSPYAILSLSILFVPMKLPSKQTYLARSILAALIVFFTAMWTLFSSKFAESQNIMTHAGDVAPNYGDQLHSILGAPIEYVGIFLKSAIVNDWLGQLAILTQQGVMLPTSLLFGSLFILLIASLYTAQELHQRLNNPVRIGLIFVGISLVTISAIATTLYLAYNPPGSNIIEGVQGRYFVPVLPMLLTGSCLLISSGRRPWSKAFIQSGSKIAYIALGLTLLASLIVYYCKVYVWV